MIRRLSNSVPMFAAVALLCVAAAHAAAQSTILTGIVRDSRGTPQIGAIVELLRPDFSVASQALTDDHGHYRIAPIIPGVYEVKASGAMFLPTLREDLRIVGGSRLVVNLTLNTLYEAFRWLPAKPRQADEPKDDWTWTLRLSANRPLLRLLEDGPLVVVSNGDGSLPTLKARVTVRGGESGFGDGGVHNDFEMERSSDDARAMIFRADLSRSSDPGLNAMVGYEQQLAPGHTFRTVANIEDRPDIAGSPGAQGLQAIEMRSGETLALTPSLSAQFGDQVEAVHLGTTILASHPFAAVTWRGGNTAVSYHMSTAPGIQQVEDLDRDTRAEPNLAERQGQLTEEHGLYQEVSIERSNDGARVRIAAWHEQIEHPVVSGGGNISLADWGAGNLLYDPSSDLLRASGQSFSGNGLMTQVEERVNRSTWITFDVAVGEALRLADGQAGQAAPAPLEQALQGMKAHQTPMVSAAVRGKLESSGMQWRASYRWQDPHSLSPVNGFASGVPDPFLSILVRQPIRCRRMIPNGVEALVDVRNLFAEGYRPFVSTDGSELYFAQAARSVEGGLSFSF